MERRSGARIQPFANAVRTQAKLRAWQREGQETALLPELMCRSARPSSSFRRRRTRRSAKASSRMLISRWATRRRPSSKHRRKRRAVGSAASGIRSAGMLPASAIRPQAAAVFGAGCHLSRRVRASLAVRAELRFLGVPPSDRRSHGARARLSGNQADRQLPRRAARCPRLRGTAGGDFRPMAPGHSPTCLEAFGVARCMFASNCPVDQRTSRLSS